MYEDIGPRRSQETRRLQSVRLAYSFELEISLEEWADWAGIDPTRARLDIDQYVTSSLPGLAGIADTGAMVHWRQTPKIRMTPAEAALLRKRWTGGNTSRPHVTMEALTFGDDAEEWG